MTDHSVHAKSSYTADWLAFRRTFTEIPLSNQIFECFEWLSGPVDNDEKVRQKLPGIIPFFEARYLLTDRLLEDTCIEQIFEYAAGLTPRSLIFGAAHPNARCVEFDLEEKIDFKKRVVRSLVDRGYITQPKNVWFASGNVTDVVALATASRPFRNEPIAILNEGLDRYLSMFERTLKLGHNLQLLKHFKGVNITADIPTKTGMAAVRKMRDTMGALAGLEAKMEEALDFKMSEHYYEDVDHAHDFHVQQGFNVERHSLVEVMDKLTSPKILGLDLNLVEEMLSSMHSFVLRPR